MNLLGLLGRLQSQPASLRTLHCALESGKVHHAYLFTGPDGVGKELAAFGLAQALVCERRGEASLFGGSTSGSGACGSCSACQRAVPREEEKRPIHPDIVVIERGLYAPNMIGRKNPETQDISIDQIRTLVLARAAFSPHEGRAKVFVIRRAEELSISAANALLKTLEEPGDRTHFILLTSQPDQLLPTILSRTLRVRFAPLPDDVVASLLEAKGIAPDRAKEVSRLAAGSVEAGVMLADPAESEVRAEFVTRALEAIAAPRVDVLLALAEDAKKEKDRLPSVIAALASALAERAAESARAGRPDAESLAVKGKAALLALEHLAGNGSAQLVVEGMLSRMRSA